MSRDEPVIFSIRDGRDHDVIVFGDKPWRIVCTFEWPICAPRDSLCGAIVPADNSVCQSNRGEMSFIGAAYGATLVILERAKYGRRTARKFLDETDTCDLFRIIEARFEIAHHYHKKRCP